MDTIQQAYVDDSGQAHIGNIVTSLAGCDSECDKHCIRKNARLKYRWNLKKGMKNGKECPLWMPERRI